jgi:site-specific recombinase XerD
LAKERSTFLSHLAVRGTHRSTLLRYARQLRVIAHVLGNKGDPVTDQKIARCAKRWAQRQRQRGRARTLKWPAVHFVQVARAWYRFMGRLHQEPEPTPTYAKHLEAWALFLSVEVGLAESTISNYGWWANSLLQWLSSQGVPWRSITLARIDEFMKHLSSRGLNRVSLATAAKALRCFVRYAYLQGWCRKDFAPAILAPHLFCYEKLPTGPAWLNVKRLLEATQGATPKDLRNRAILLLLAVYGLRRGEVIALRLEDVDWTRNILRVQRNKTARVQEFPLTAMMAQALDRYLKKARPEGFGPNVFLSLHAPYRALSGNGVYDLTRSLMDRLDISSIKRGPHSLRHACASYLLNRGLPLKQVGDHLGHRSPSATQIYAKVDLNGLRTVATFDLGGLR